MKKKKENRRELPFLWWFTSDSAFALIWPRFWRCQLLILAFSTQAGAKSCQTLSLHRYTLLFHLICPLTADDTLHTKPKLAFFRWRCHALLHRFPLVHYLLVNAFLVKDSKPFVIFIALPHSSASWNSSSASIWRPYHLTSMSAACRSLVSLLVYNTNYKVHKVALNSRLAWQLLWHHLNYKK